MRHGEDPGSFVPPNEAQRGNWYYINPPELAVASGLPHAAPLVEVVTGGWGQGVGVWGWVMGQDSGAADFCL